MAVNAKYFDTVSQATADTSLVVGDVVILKDRANGIFDVVATSGVTPNTFNVIVGVYDPTISLDLRMGDYINVRTLGATGLGVVDDYPAINQALVLARPSGRKVYFPINPDNGSNSTVYKHAQSLTFEATGVSIEGESTKVALNYTGTGTGLLINASYASPQRERCSLSNISLTSSTGSIAFDWTGGNYGIYHDFEIAYTAANAKLLFAQGSGGVGPHFNKFEGFTLFGGSDRSQIGIELDEDTSGHLAPGPNSNEFSQMKRAASLSRAINLKVGTGNLFCSMSAESISDAMIVLNDVTSAADSGTATSATSNTLTDTSKSWSTTPGNALNFTNDTVLLTGGTYNGETRVITANTTDTLTLNKPWPADIGTPTYQILNGQCVKNMFVNLRQEGLASDNPDGIRIKPGARGNELSQLELGSLGTGKVLDDESGDPSNQVRQGDLVVDTFVVSNPGANQSIEVVPRNSVFGGLRGGSAMVLEYIDFNCPNFVLSGSAEAVLTVDHGGSTTGGGSPSLVAKINAFNPDSAFIASSSKVVKSTINNGIFIKLTTNADVNSASDFIIKVAYRQS